MSDAEVIHDDFLSKKITVLMRKTEDMKNMKRDNFFPVRAITYEREGSETFEGIENPYREKVVRVLLERCLSAYPSFDKRAVEGFIVDEAKWAVDANHPETYQENFRGEVFYVCR